MTSDATGTDIGLEFGVTKQRINQILSNAFRKLKLGNAKEVKELKQLSKDMGIAGNLLEKKR